MGALPVSGIGVRVATEAMLHCSGARGSGATGFLLQVVPDADALRRDCLRSNMQLLPSLKEDAHAAELYKMTCEDAALGRMTAPAPAADCDLEAVRLHPRFSVEQGVKDDGAVKIRAVVHLSWSTPAESSPRQRRSKKRTKQASVNGHVAVPEQLKHDHLDDLFAAMSLFYALGGLLPGIFKADVDAAFRYAASASGLGCSMCRRTLAGGCP